MDIKSRTALVTGGATRVGRALSLGLAAQGANVFVHYNSSAGPAEETAAVVESLGVRAAIGSANLSDPSAASGLIDAVVAALGPPSILINSASGFASDTLGDVTIDGFRAAQNLSLVSPIFLTQAMASSLPDDETGAVVNVTDVRVARPYAEHFSYIVAKGGLDTFTAAAAVALAPRIRVNGVALGVILPPADKGDDYAEKLAKSLPMQRPGGTDPVVDAVVYLVSSSFVTGEIIRIDGGGHLV